MSHKIYDMCNVMFSFVPMSVEYKISWKGCTRCNTNFKSWLSAIFHATSSYDHSIVIGHGMDSVPNSKKAVLNDVWTPPPTRE